MKLRPLLIALVVLAALGAYVYFYEIPKGEEREKAEEEEKKVLALDWDQVNEIRMQRYKEMVVLRKEEGSWKLLQPVQDLADSFTVETILDDLKNLTAQRRLEGMAERLRDFGLAAPPIRVTVATPAISRTLLLGDESQVGGTRFAKLEDAPEVLVVSQAVFSAVNKDVTALRNKRVFLGLDREKLASIEVWQGERKLFRLEKNEGKWSITHPIQAAADQTEADRLVNYLLYLNIRVFYAEKDDGLARFGLDPPRLAVVLAEKEKAWPRLLVGKENEGATEVFAKREDKDPVLLLPRDVPERAAPTLFALRDKRVLAAAKEDIRRVELQFSDRSFKLENLDGKWVCPEAPGREVDPFKAEELVRALQDLRATEFFEKPEDPATYGLVPPALRVRVAKDGTTVLADLAVGKDRDEKRVYLARAADGLVMSVERAFLDKLPRTPEDLLVPPPKEEGAAPKKDEGTTPPPEKN